MQRAAILIDGRNLLKAADRLKRRVNLAALAHAALAHSPDRYIAFQRFYIGPTQRVERLAEEARSPGHEWVQCSIEGAYPKTIVRVLRTPCVEGDVVEARILGVHNAGHISGRDYILHYEVALDENTETWTVFLAHLAGQHAEQAHVHFFQNLTLGHVQLDELYATLRDKANDLWVWVAFDPATKLIPALQLGSRTQDLVYALIHALSQVLAPGCLPVLTSDGLNLYFYAITAHFGQWSTDTATGKTRWQVACDLLYGQVKKTYRRRRLYLVGHLMRLVDLTMGAKK